MTTSNLRASRRAVVRLGIASGATFQSPAWCSLAMCERPALGGGLPLEVLDLADGQLVGGKLAAGRIVDDVLADAQGLLHVEVLGRVLRLVPVAGEVAGAVDDHRAAAVLDAQERVDLRAQLPAGAPDGVLGGEGVQRVFGLGEEFGHQVAEAPVERLRVAAGVGDEEPALLDVFAQVLLRLAAEGRAPRGR